MYELYKGDCLEVMAGLGSGVIDMVLTDPPYGTTACKWDSIISLAPMWEHLKRVIKPNGAIVMTASQPFTTTLIASNMKMFKYSWVWEKSQAVGHLNAYRMPLKNVEDITVFYNSPPVYNPELKDKPAGNIRPETKVRKHSQCYGAHAKESFRKIPLDKTLPTQLLRFNNCQQNLHPTQKPVALMEYLIKTYTNQGDTVLDFTMGSGTTGVACASLGRRFIGIEKEEKYFNIAKERIEQAHKKIGEELAG